jgi:hypothetical protein
LATRIDSDSRVNRWKQFQMQKNEMFHSRNASERFTNLTMATESARSVFHTDSRSPSFNDPLHFGHIYRNSTTICPLPHTDPEHSPSPLDPATWPHCPSSVPAAAGAPTRPDFALLLVTSHP